MRRTLMKTLHGCITAALITGAVGSADFNRPYFFRIFNWKNVYDSDMK